MLSSDSLKENLSTSLKEMLSVGNVGFWLKIINCFSGDDCSLNFIERWFTVLANNEQFLECSINQMKKIFASSSLNISSEHELVGVANDWIKYDTNQRSKYAIELIKKIRLPLLSYAALYSILKGKTSFSECVKCIEHINNAIAEKSNVANLTSINYQTRYCDQNNFDLLVSGFSTLKNSRRVYQSKGDGFSKILDEITHNETAVVFMDGVVYFVSNKFIHRYSILTKKYLPVEKVIQNCSGFCTVGFMGCLFILGGGTNYCNYFKPKTNDWYTPAFVSEETVHSSCTVFEGKIVFSGGTECSRFILHHRPRRGVEIYDFFANRWSPMPNMLQRRTNHASIGIRNKLFIIGGSRTNTCEMYDSFGGNFVNINPMMQINAALQCSSRNFSFVTMGNKLTVFNSNCGFLDGFPLKSIEYDVETEQLSERKDVKLPDVLSKMFVVKVPKL